MSVLAISINGGIKTLGAYAGLAAVVIIALLVLLYFAQAREIRRLSEWVERDTARRLAPPVPPAPAPRPAVAAPQQGPPAGPGAPVVTTVEGARRVPIPAAAATSTPLPVVAPPLSSSPDATTVSGEAAPSAAETAVTPHAQETAVQESAAGAEPLLPPAPDGPPPAPPASDDAESLLPPAPQATAPPLPRLIADTVPGQAAGAVHELGGGLLIGRGKVASLRLSDPLASARHARIAKQGEQFVIEDLGSTNGTFVNGAMISAPIPLGEGDRVRLGESEFVFAIAAAQAPQAPRPAAVPLLAAAAPERTIELDPEGAQPDPEPEPEPQPSRHRRLRFGHAEAGEPAAGLPRLPPLPEREGTQSSGHGRWIAVGAIVLALAAVAIAVVEIVPGTKPKPHHSATPPASGNAPSTGPSSTTPGSVGVTAPPPSSITVAVFNGTTQSGLAGTVAAKLANDGYVKGTIANAAAQSSTTVGYGTGERAAALEVAHSLGLPSSDVAPMTSTAAGAAGGAQVAVTVGPDYQG